MNSILLFISFAFTLAFTFAYPQAHQSTCQSDRDCLPWSKPSLCNTCVTQSFAKWYSEAPRIEKGPLCQENKEIVCKCTQGLCDAEILDTWANEPKEIALTVDDFPFVWAGAYTNEEIAKMIDGFLETLKIEKVPMTIFAIGNQIGNEHFPILDKILKEGHSIGNHTQSHMDLATTDAELYKLDIVSAQDLLEKWMKKGSRFFRYPYLSQGETASKRKSIEDTLQKLKLTVAPVTVDSSDWKFNAPYSEAMANKKPEEALEVVRSYVNSTRGQTVKMRIYARKKWTKPIKHILLMHINRINADHVGKIIQTLKADGWKFISLEEAMKDPVYQEKDNYLGPSGRTWLEMLYGLSQ